MAFRDYRESWGEKVKSKSDPHDDGLIENRDVSLIISFQCFLGKRPFMPSATASRGTAVTLSSTEYLLVPG